MREDRIPLAPGIRSATSAWASELRLRFAAASTCRQSPTTGRIMARPARPKTFSTTLSRVAGGAAL